MCIFMLSLCVGKLRRKLKATNRRGELMHNEVNGDAKGGGKELAATLT